ncbi:MAG: branched-chain-amino-acid transaminase [Gammaproteobacteria bacterium]|nr:branched-chain-amino-acid transaminase [Gammaproteobacteria bacterium]
MGPLTQQRQTTTPGQNAPAQGPVCWLNGDIMPLADAKIPVLDHGLLYGDGVFEGIRFYHGRAFRLDIHLARLAASAAAIRLTLPYDLAAFTQAVQTTIAAFGRADGYLRLVVTRGVGKLGIDPSSCARPNVFIVADDISVVPERVREQGARVIIAATRRLPADGLDPRVKSLNYLNHVLARLEAVNAAADEAILLNAAGRVTEGSVDNVFIVRAGELLTPPVSDGALDGVTRDAVLKLAPSLGLPARATSLTPYDLYTADECFLTGTAAELIPVREIDARPLRACPGPVYEQIGAAFKKLVEQETA